MKSCIHNSEKLYNTLVNKQLVKPNDPILLKIAELIPYDGIKTLETKELIEQMLTASYGRRKNRNKPTVVGLAAPQIGISKRIIAVDIGADGKGDLSKLKIYINPEIIWKSEKKEEWYEGCWSTDRVCGIVKRPKSVKIRAFDVKGKKLEKKYTGYVARIFQHEIDHLNGVEFVSHISDDNKLHWVEEVEFPEYRNNGAWRNWPNKYPREKWEKIKRIKPSI